jgi:Microsomal signal peptidase 25 kDa subunit (SPC25)
MRIFLSQLTLQSSVQKHKPTYKLKVLFEAPSGQKWEDKEIEGSFMEWFNEDGHLRHVELKKWLARSIEVVGRADPQSKAVVEEVLVDDDLGSGVVVAPSGTSAVEGSSSVKGRRSKKKG